MMGCFPCFAVMDKAPEDGVSSIVHRNKYEMPGGENERGKKFCGLVFS